MIKQYRTAFVVISAFFATPAFAEDVMTVPMEMVFLERHDGSFFMTADSNEMKAVEEVYYIGGRYGTVYVFNRPVRSSVPLYRYRAREGTNHFYTISKEEGDQAVSRYNFIAEGICCYVFSSQIPGSVPLYRLQRGSLGPGHIYLINEESRHREVLTGKIFEGIAAYVFPKPTAHPAE